MCPQRLYVFPMFILGAGQSGSKANALLTQRKQRGAHYALDGGAARFECDDFPADSGLRPGNARGNVWRIFIR